MDDKKDREISIKKFIDDVKYYRNWFDNKRLNIDKEKIALLPIRISLQPIFEEDFKRIYKIVIKFEGNFESTRRLLDDSESKIREYIDGLRNMDRGTISALLKINIESLNNNYNKLDSIPWELKQEVQKLNDKIEEKKWRKVRFKEYNTLTKLDFGKYEGKTINEVLDIDPSYVDRCIINIDNFLLIQEAVEKIKNLQPKFILSLGAERWLDIKEGKWQDMMHGYGGGSDNYDESTYEEFGGSYAQDIGGYSDQAINDAFEGDPDNYWNID